MHPLIAVLLNKFPIRAADIATSAFGTLTDLTNAGGAEALGTSGRIPDAAHRHALDFGAVSNLTGTAADGTSTSAARADHLHDYGTGSIGVTDLASSVAVGTMTPSLSGSTTPGTHTYAIRVGRYTRILDTVTWSFIVSLSAKDAAMAGNVQVNLPVTSANVTNLFQAVAVECSGIDLTAGYSQFVGRIAPNASVMTLMQTGDNVSVSNLAAASIAATSQIIGTVTYLVA